VYTVIYKDTKIKFKTLEQAITFATDLGIYVTIKGNGIEVVGIFGVDSIVDGKCPDGVAYDWNKESRIGGAKR